MSSLKKTFIIIFSFAIVAYSLLGLRWYQSHKYFQEHPFKYAIGTKVKVHDAVCYIVRQDQGGFVSDQFYELYVVCLENTNVKIQVKGSEITKP